MSFIDTGTADASGTDFSGGGGGSNGGVGGKASPGGMDPVSSFLGGGNQVASNDFMGFSDPTGGLAATAAMTGNYGPPDIGQASAIGGDQYASNDQGSSQTAQPGTPGGGTAVDTAAVSPEQQYGNALLQGPHGVQSFALGSQPQVPGPQGYYPQYASAGVSDADTYPAQGQQGAAGGPSGQPQYGSPLPQAVPGQGAPGTQSGPGIPGAAGTGNQYGPANTGDIQQLSTYSPNQFPQDAQPTSTPSAAGQAGKAGTQAGDAVSDPTAPAPPATAGTAGAKGTQSGAAASTPTATGSEGAVGPQGGPQGGGGNQMNPLAFIGSLMRLVQDAMTGNVQGLMSDLQGLAGQVQGQGGAAGIPGQAGTQSGAPQYGPQGSPAFQNALANSPANVTPQQYRQWYQQQQAAGAPMQRVMPPDQFEQQYNQRQQGGGGPNREPAASGSQRRRPDSGPATMPGDEPDTGPSDPTMKALTEGYNEAAKSEGQPQIQAPPAESGAPVQRSEITYQNPGFAGQPMTGKPTQPSVDRTQYKQFVATHPQVIQRLADITNGEVAGGINRNNLRGQQAFLETVFNGAYNDFGSNPSGLMRRIGGLGPYKATAYGGYYEGLRRASPQQVQIMKGALNKVLDGSNMSDVGWGPMTGNASGNVAARAFHSRGLAGYTMKGSDTLFREGRGNHGWRGFRQFPTLPQDRSASPQSSLEQLMALVG